jgi:hypothetical protein
MALSRTAVDEGSKDQSPGARVGSVLAGPGDFWQRSAMAKRVMLYAIALALAVAGLAWLEYRYVTRVFSTEIYIVLLATGFARLGAAAAQPEGSARDALRRVIAGSAWTRRYRCSPALHRR